MANYAVVNRATVHSCQPPPMDRNEEMKKRSFQRRQQDMHNCVGNEHLRVQTVFSIYAFYVCVCVCVCDGVPLSVHTLGIRLQTGVWGLYTVKAKNVPV